MNDKNYSIVKLSNGDNIICNVINNFDNTIEVEAPLKLESHARLTKNGIAESLSLTRWMQPFCDEKKFTLQKNSIIINVPASLGLSKYYEFILKKINGLDMIEPSEKELKQIEVEEKNTEEDDLLDKLIEKLPKGNVTIH
tara:strand:+ start:252 stop:671 length:420 start_codon:yes stop_codon:yes gene_type:complete